jgi:hypothetical protein
MRYAKFEIYFETYPTVKGSCMEGVKVLQIGGDQQNEDF